MLIRVIAIQFSDGFETTVTSVEENEGSTMAKVYPNPFREATGIIFKLSQPAEVELAIYNLNGLRIETLVDANLSEGEHVIEWKAHAQSSGIYYYQLIAGRQHVATGKLISME